MSFQTAKITAVCSSVLAIALASTSAHAATASAAAKATILEQVTVTKTSDLDFGTIVVGATGGNVVLSSANGSVNCAAALVCTGTTKAAAFDVTGTTGQTVNVTTATSVTLNNGTNNMTATLSGSDTSIVLDGTDAFTVGGTLAVAANQASGNYVGNFNVTVAYQ